MREAIHTVFLYHAIQAGMDMGIVNAGMVGVYDDLEPGLRERVEDVVLNAAPTPRAPGRDRRNAKGARQRTSKSSMARRARAPQDRQRAPDHALVHGITDFITEDTEEAHRAIRPRVGARCTSSKARSWTA